jgi:hypothetical protein
VIDDGAVHENEFVPTLDDICAYYTDFCLSCKDYYGAQARLSQMMNVR